MDHKTILKPVIAGLLFSLFSLSSLPSFAQDLGNGEELFTTNCARCHYADERALTGPGLKGVEARWQGNAENLTAWIRNSKAYLANANDPYATALYEQYNKQEMPAFLSLSETDVADVLAYVAVYKGDEVVNGQTGEASGPNWGLLLMLGLLALVLLVVALVLSRVIGGLDKVVRKASGEDVEEVDSVPLFERESTKKIGGLIGLVCMLALGYFAYSGAYDLGRQEGYQPTQPIRFSHKLHAGINKIDCEYCHSGAREGKSAVIPSTNVCMNCHKAVDEGPEYGKTEIAKIYDAIGWDAKEKKYIEDYEQKPVKWVRIHNLPDHVYFNHAQHVNVGNLACQDCHGPVEEMEVVEQYQNLSMGWCVNCHRETEVQFASNPYYHETFKELHSHLSSQDTNLVRIDRSLITEGALGGTECQKCHY